MRTAHLWAWAWTVAFFVVVMGPYEARQLEPTRWTDAAAALGVALWLWVVYRTLQHAAAGGAPGLANVSAWTGLIALFASSGLYFLTFNVPGALPSQRFKELAGFESWQIERVDPQTLRYLGPFSPNGAQALADSLTFQDRVLELHSPGGLVSAGFQIASLVKREGLAVKVDRICASACALPFFAADQRLMGQRGRIGVHQVSPLDSTNSAPEQVRAVGRLADQVLLQGGFPPEFLPYAFERGGQQMFWLSARQLASLQLAQLTLSVFLPPPA